MSGEVLTDFTKQEFEELIAATVGDAMKLYPIQMKRSCEWERTGTVSLIISGAKKVEAKKPSFNLIAYKVSCDKADRITYNLALPGGRSEIFCPFCGALKDYTEAKDLTPERLIPIDPYTVIVGDIHNGSTETVEKTEEPKPKAQMEEVTVDSNVLGKLVRGRTLGLTLFGESAFSKSEFIIGMRVKTGVQENSARIIFARLLKYKMLDVQDGNKYIINNNEPPKLSAVTLDRRNMTKMSSDEIIYSPEAASILGICPATLIKRAKLGLIPSGVRGSRLIFSRSTIKKINKAQVEGLYK